MVRFPDARLLLTVHDELVFEVKTDEVAAFSAWVKDVMESTYTLRVPWCRRACRRELGRRPLTISSSRRNDLSPLGCSPFWCAAQPTTWASAFQLDGLRSGAGPRCPRKHLALQSSSSCG